MQSDFLSLPHHGHNNGSDYDTLFANVDPSYVFVNTSADKAAERISGSASLTYLMNSLHVEEIFIADNGYTVMKLPHNGEDEPATIANYSEQQDHLSWGVFTK